MSKPFNINIDLLKNELQNARLQNLASAPSSPVVGQMYFDTASLRAYWWNGTAWTNFATDSALLNAQAGSYYLARANHTGTQLAATISDFTSAVQALRWASMTAPNAAVPMASQNFSSLGAASSAGQAVEYAQWQAALAAQSSGMDFKSTPVTVVATGNVTISAPGATINGHTMAAGETFLAPLQTTSSEKGIYLWNGASSPATRRSDANSAGSVVSGTLVATGAAGTANPDTVWMQTAIGTGTGGAIVLGTDAQNWLMPFSASAYTFSNGLQNASGTITVLPDPVAGGGILVSAAGVKVDPSVVVRKFAADFGDGSATTYNITHGLGTLDVMVQVYIKSSGQEVGVDVVRTSTTVVQINTATAPAANAYRLVVQA